MFSHITLGANDVAAAKTLYDALFAAMGAEPGVMSPDGGRVRYLHRGSPLIITRPLNGEPATAGNGTTFGFVLDSAAQVDAWHAAGVAHGGTAIEDPPGPRSNPAFGNLYLAYLRDQVGNKLCAVFPLA
jgi:catechol 2,3-dioxygenase-like lactoylglutathione lyase family enzyme